MEAGREHHVTPHPRAALRYREAPPGRELRAAIACYWQIDGDLVDGQSHDHRVLPDACVDIVFDLAAWRRFPTPDAARLVGTMTRAMRFTFAGSVELLGVRFLPGGAPLVCADSLRELTDGTAPAETWLGVATVSLLTRLAAATALSARTRLLDQFLCNEIREHAVDAAVAAAAKIIDSCGSDPPAIAGVARSLGMGERQLERRFLAATGLAPVVYRRVRRFRRLLEACDGPCAGSWADAAAAAGYFDQAHMTREFERLAGISPRAWRAEQADVGFVQEARLTVR